MKYLLIGENGKNEQELLDRIAAFLWDNGNMIYTRGRFQTQTGYRNMAQCCDCFVFVSLREYPATSYFWQEQAFFPKGFEFEKSFTRKIILVVSNDGVYCNAIPSPHKIFHFEGLYQNELTRFFRWCRKFNLFQKCSPFY